MYHTHPSFKILFPFYCGNFVWSAALPAESYRAFNSIQVASKKPGSLWIELLREVYFGGFSLSFTYLIRFQQCRLSPVTQEVSVTVAQIVSFQISLKYMGTASLAPFNSSYPLHVSVNTQPRTGKQTRSDCLFTKTTANLVSLHHAKRFPTSQPLLVYAILPQLFFHTPFKLFLAQWQYRIFLHLHPVIYSISTVSSL